MDMKAGRCRFVAGQTLGEVEELTDALMALSPSWRVAGGVSTAREKNGESHFAVMLVREDGMTTKEHERWMRAAAGMQLTLTMTLVGALEGVPDGTKDRLMDGVTQLCGSIAGPTEGEGTT